MLCIRAETEIDAKTHTASCFHIFRVYQCIIRETIAIVLDRRLFGGGEHPIYFLHSMLIKFAFFQSDTCAPIGKPKISDIFQL